MNFFSVVLASTLTCQPVPDAGQIGFWEATRSSMGGIANNIELRTDGSYSRAMTVLVDFIYKVEDNILYSAPDGEGPVSFTNPREITISNDSYSLTNHEGEKETRKRIGTGQHGSITGVYSYRHGTGAIAYEKYTDDGLFHLRIPMRLEHGCYSIDKEEMSLEPEEKPTYKTYFYFESSDLVLDDFKRKSYYKLVPEGAWYHVDKVDYVKPESFTPEN